MFVKMTAQQFLAEMSAASRDSRGDARQPVKSSKPGRATRNSPEEDLQRVTKEWVDLHVARYPALVWMMHCPSGGKRPKGEAGKLKAMGAKRGVSDWICPFPSQAAAGLAIELKAPKGKTTPEQEAFLSHAAQHGWVCAVCYSLDEFIVTVMRYLAKD